MINGKQQTIKFHVDNLKSSHINPKVNDQFKKWLNKIYGGYGEVKTTRGNKHDYLGMTFKFMNGEVKIDMIDYIEIMLKEFPLKLRHNNNT